MKRYSAELTEENYKICGKDNGSPLAISRAVTKQVFQKESLHSHDGYEFYMFLKGKAELEVNGEIVTVGAGDVILVEAGEKHKIVNILEELDYVAIKEAQAERINH